MKEPLPFGWAEEFYELCEDLANMLEEYMAIRGIPVNIETEVKAQNLLLHVRKRLKEEGGE